METNCLEKSGTIISLTMLDEIDLSKKGSRKYNKEYYFQKKRKDG